MSTTTGKFDLNMEDVLEAWRAPDALREVIANALDEQALTETDNISITEDEKGRWHIRDHGRGLQYEHFTQNENEEKLANPDTVIGKFGVGLKDALATFHRHGHDVTIHSAHNTFRVEKAPKHGFEDVSTLHVDIQPPEQDISGTDVVIDGCTAEDVAAAKAMFLQFTDEERLEATRFGEVYSVPPGERARIYVNGLRVAEEDNFLFSYNITKTTKKVREALNRERSNVGRTAYSSRVKTILESCESTRVAEPLVRDLENFEQGTTHDELSWKPIRIHACKLLNANDEVVFLTPNDERRNSDVVLKARNDGYRTVIVPENIRNELSDVEDAEGNEIRNIDRYVSEYNESFSYDWVAPEELTADEYAVWEQHEHILAMLPEVPAGLNEVRISETMRISTQGQDTVLGRWQPAEGWIIIRRDQLACLTKFAGIFLHELAHARNPFAGDLTHEFEMELTQLLGEVANAGIGSRSD